METLQSCFDGEEKICEGKECDTSYFCLICYSVIERSGDGYILPCKHIYCRSCIEAYIESNIVAGQTLIKCFHVDNSEPNNIGKSSTPCNAIIPENTILDILKMNSEYSSKYHRFKYLKSNTNARECPHCSHLEIGDPQHPKMVCQSCNKDYCFAHALAHNSDVSCSEYEKSISSQDEVNIELISRISKPCPGCGMHVSKTEGCNHMKVRWNATHMWNPRWCSCM